ncbi:polyprenyl synthetase family protein [Virgibacillus siamensis]|uniref:polyprenyl synthetase family protein n=1 Tax=Virgibacillus siamensis TaxID=480071 RepID=UPI001FE682B9|nr:farnesyl diphosphate synthase [Virgibacillus siamensis]
MQTDLDDFIIKGKAIVEDEMINQFRNLEIPDQLKQSMLYSLKAGGKRLRPILMMASYDAFHRDINKVLSAAIALEMIHTYSLIHDDLPAMDDDDLRRGQPTNHKAFDEATAILAGDALLTYSFELIANDPQFTDRQKVYLTGMLAQASGPKGMVAGQILDMEAEQKKVTLEELETIHKLKTGELLRFAIRAGAYIGGASSEQLKHLDNYAYYLGLIFQVQDDILDITGDPEKLGKPVGSDLENDKNTYPKLLGLNGAIEKKQNYVNKAKVALENAGANTSYLTLLTDYFSNREF